MYVKFPKTGLGNMLLLWARAVVFARINHFELVTSSWWGFRWGALVRQEQKKRLYWKYFREAAVFSRIKALWYLKYRKVIVEPKAEYLSEDQSSKCNLYLFNKVMPDYNLFDPLRGHYNLIVNELHCALRPSKKKLLDKYERPVIGIHIRRGDFKLGSTLTPLNYFIEGIKIIREISGDDWPVTVFTDAGKEEIETLLSLPATRLAEEKADILDILLLSKSDVLLLSGGSTFSYWAAFLSNAFVIRPMNDWLGNIKTQAPEYSNYVEIKWQHDELDSTLKLKETFNSWQQKTSSR